MPVFSSLDNSHIIQLLQSGGIGVIPTDTIYGLAALAHLEQSALRLYDLKNRYGKLGTFVAADVEQLIGLGLDEAMLRSVAHLWPNPISVVVPFTKPGSHLDLGKGSLAVRIPNDAGLLALLRKVGPLVTSSANLFDQPPAVTIDEAQAYFGDKVDFYVDSGGLAGRPPSTIIRLQDDGGLEVLRQGAVTINKQGEIVA